MLQIGGGLDFKIILLEKLSEDIFADWEEIIWL